MIFLASPYSHPEAAIRRARFEAARAFCWSHMQRGRVIFSPIAYGHQFAEVHYADTSAAAWIDFNTRLLLASDELWVLTIHGWEDSIGVAAEIELARNHSLVITYKEPLPNAYL